MVYVSASFLVWTLDSKRSSVSHQAVVMSHLMEGLPKVTGHSSGSVMYRPFFVFWFMGQISRALTLWSLDNSLLVALDVGKAIMVPVEYLMALFPCDGALSVVSATGSVLTWSPSPTCRLRTSPRAIGGSLH